MFNRKTVNSYGAKRAPNQRRRVERGAGPRGRCTRVPGLERTRARYGNDRRGTRLPSGRRGRTTLRAPSRKLLIGIGLIAAIGTVAYLLGAFEPSTVEPTSIARQFVYTAPTANDAAIALPDAVKTDLREIGLHHQQIAWTRVDSTSRIDTTIIDMTPRSGNSPDSPVLKIEDRALQAIDAQISFLESSMNASRASTGDRALFSGLTKITFGGAPVTIISSGLDLAKPVDFRTLNWTVPAQQVIATVKRSGELPDLHRAAVTFVVVPAAGVQEQLRDAQTTYRNALWSALLASSYALSVTFLDATGSNASSLTPAPAVAVPALPDTPIRPVQDPINPKKAVCSLPSASYFKVNRALLLDQRKTIHDLQSCITAALAVDASIELDGWTSYEGPLAANGTPAVDDPDNRTLSMQRVQTIADLLVRDMHVPHNTITRETGHGNVDQPDPDPRSPANRLVVISYFTK